MNNKLHQKILVHEVFHSIQGESSFAGLPCIFIRLTGCNLRCSYCDTTYAFSEGQEETVQTLVERIKLFPCNLVEITGGEPLCQEGTPSLVGELINRGYTVLVETNGSCDIGKISSQAIKIVDVKCPGSGAADSFMLSNVAQLQPHDECKFVVSDTSDFDWSSNFVQEYRLLEKCKVVFSSVFERVTARELAKWILASGMPIRLGLQIHKYIWSPQQRGV